MDVTNVKLLSKAALRRELNLSPERYKQVIALGLLPVPTTYGGSRVLHTPFDLEIYRKNLERRAYQALEPNLTYKPMKPISEKHAAILRQQGEMERAKRTK